METGKGALVREGWEAIDEAGHKLGPVMEVHRDYLIVRHGHFMKKDVRIQTENIVSTDAAKHCVQVRAAATPVA